MNKSNVIAGLRHQLREAQKLIGLFDLRLSQMDPGEVDGLPRENVDECDCDDRSWHGVEHDSACPLASLRRE